MKPMSADNCQGDQIAMMCGTSPRGMQIRHHHLNGISGVHATLLPTAKNQTASLRAALRVSGSYGGLSLTSHLVRIARRGARGQLCEAYLGVGHLHRGEGSLNRKMFKRRQHGPPPWELGNLGGGSEGDRQGKAGGRAESGRRAHAQLRRRQPFAFGFRYR